MRSYDYIIAGGGAAGLSLAIQILQSNLSDRSILILDPKTKTKNDRTWCFWTNRPSPLDPILYHSWNQIRFTGPSFDALIPLGKYRYQMVRGLDFYQHAREVISRHPQVHLVQGNVEAIRSQSDGAEVVAGQDTFKARYAFDSRVGPQDIQPDPARYHYLKQHFIGWLVETDHPAFDPQTPTLFDFRTPQNGAMRFMYILPDSPTQALVEYTLFSPTLLADEEYEQALATYLKDVLCVPGYRVLEKERGVIPMTDHPFPRRAGSHVLNIGTKGGRVKPSTGYAFLRIQQDSAAIVDSLIRHGHPFALPQSPSRYRLYDSILLQIMMRYPEDCAFIFNQMFKNNPPERLFRFLDERGPFWNDLRLMASLPVYRFIEGLVRLKLLHKI